MLGPSGDVQVEAYKINCLRVVEHFDPILLLTLSFGAFLAGACIERGFYPWPYSSLEMQTLNPRCSPKSSRITSPNHQNVFLMGALINPAHINPGLIIQFGCTWRFLIRPTACRWTSNRAGARSGPARRILQLGIQVRVPRLTG